uniref:C-type lectin domain-containing protein n=1 Tax=Amphiprion ocellaris TaxID=80972 RepID=A0A3Q1AY70_AMPOC
HTRTCSMALFQVNWHDRQPNNRKNEDIGSISYGGTWYDGFGRTSHPFYCKQTNLSSLLSETDRLLAQTEIQNRNITERVWMGLHFLGDRWMWVNGDPLEYEAWSHQGGQDHQCPIRRRCGALTKDGLWENWDCQDKLNFFYFK